MRREKRQTLCIERGKSPLEERHDTFMANNILTKLFGNYSKRELKRIQPLVDQVLGLEDKYRKMSDEELKAQTGVLKDRLQGGASLEKKHLDAMLLCLEQGGETDLPGGVRARCSQGVFSFEFGREPGGFSVGAALGKTSLPCGKDLILEVKPLEKGQEKPKIHNLLFKNALDYDIITGNLRARSRQEGDRFSPAGRRVTKSLKQLFQENKIPLSQRNRTVLLEAAGKLVFCEGVGPAEGFQVTERTERALLVQIREEKKA